MERLKYKISLLILLLLMVFSLNIVTAHNRDENLPLFGKVITVDAGHPSLDKPNVIVVSCSK